MNAVLKAPFPYFGGKSRIADLVWSRLGDVDNFIEPFCGSAAVLLRRPTPPRIETINDADCMVANFWRATQADPESVAMFADSPVNEADLHARHKWLVLSDEAKDFRRRMRSDPTYYDVRFAGWWCWGLCCWIGGGWCTEQMVDVKRFVANVGDRGSHNGVNANLPAGTRHRKPRIDGGEGQLGHGVHTKGEQEPRVQLPYIAGLHGDVGRGMVNEGVLQRQGHRPQLADAYDVGRGVNSQGDLGTCDARRAWLVEWFGRLRDRLRLVRVCCGDWLRVCDSESVTTRLGTTGIFFDPPYSAAAGRDMNLYATDCGQVAHAVRAYCLERGSDKRYRIALCGYEGEGHEELETAGWEVVAWEAHGGYGNRSTKGKENAKKERIWFSPGCLTEPGLFDSVAEAT